MVNEDLASDDWRAVGVEELHLFLRRGIEEHGVLEHGRAFIRNLVYTLQYIDYLLHLLEKGGVPATLRSQTSKSVVIAGMGVVEAILSYVLRKAGALATSEWEGVREQVGQPFTDGPEERRLITRIERRLTPPGEVEMTLDQMLKRVERRGLLGVDGHQVYKDLNHLRQLRNRVHIHGVQGNHDTDWFRFTDREVALMLSALHSILETEMFSPEPHHTTLLRFLAPGRGTGAGEGH